MKLFPFALAATLAGASSLPFPAFSQTSSYYQALNKSVAVYGTLNSVQSQRVENKRQDQTNHTEERTVCQDMVQVDKKLFVDFEGYLRLYRKETPWVKCLRYALQSVTSYPQALVVSQNGGNKLTWKVDVGLQDSINASCGIPESTISTLTYQGVDLINGRPSDQVKLSPQDHYGGNYTRETAKGILKVVSRGTFTLPTGERAVATEYSFDLYQWYTKRPKQGQGWGQVPLFRMFSGKSGNAATSSSPPIGSPHTREYAKWFVDNPPQKNLCKFTIVDLGGAPKYQEQMSTTTKPNWVVIGRG